MCKRKPAAGLIELFLQVYSRAIRAADVRSVGLKDALRELAFDRDDVRQEMLVRIWIALPAFDPKRGSISTYIEHLVSTSIASLLRRLRTKRRTKPTDVTEPAEPPDVFLSAEFRLDFERLLRDLSPRDRKVFQLLAENKPAQVARALRISRSAVYRSITRIRKALSTAGFC